MRIDAICAGVHHVAQFFGRLEKRHAFRRNVYARTGLRITSDAGLALPRTEAAKPPNLYFVIALKCFNDALKEGVYNHLAIPAGQIAKCGDLINQVSLRHALPFFLVFLRTRGIKRGPDLVAAARVGCYFHMK